MTTEELLILINKERKPMNLLLETLILLKKTFGYQQDLLTPGFIKEWIVSDILSHDCHKTKHGPDAFSKDGLKQYEYLTAKKGGTFQLDRIHENNLYRVERNDAIFFAVFDNIDGISCQQIWQCDTDIYLQEVKRKIQNQRKKSSMHVTTSLKWVKENSKQVF